jgi:hypothetical protein
MPIATDLIYLVVFLILFAVIAAGAVAVMRLLRPAQRAVVVAGLLAAAVQIYYPPLARYEWPKPNPQPAGRHPFSTRLTYRPSDLGVWIDAKRQIVWLAVTLIATAAVCGLIAYRSARRPVPPDTPAPVA